MNVTGSPVVEAADRLHDVIYPPNGRMLPRHARIDELRSGISELSHGLVERAVEEPEVNDELIFAAGAYCAAEAYLEHARHDAVDLDTSVTTAHNFNEAAEYFRRNRSEWRNNSDSLGAMAEFVILSTLWNGISDRVFVGHAFMARSPAQGPSEGLRSDIDIEGSIDGKRQKLQVKLSRRKESYIYEDGITVVSPESLVNEPGSRRLRGLAAVDRLLRIGQDDASHRLEVYDKLRPYLED